MSQQMSATDLLTESFSFGFNRFFTVLRCLLLPYIILIFGAIAVMLALLDFEAIIAFEDAEPTSPEEVAAMFGALFKFGWGTTIFLFIAGITILSLPFYGALASIFRLVGLGEEPGGWFSLRLDGPMWRTFFAWLIIGILQYLFMGMGLLIAYAMNPGMFDFLQNFETIDQDPGPLFSFMGSFFLTFVIAILLCMFVFTKLAPFPAASACENRLMLINSWSRTKGHFWTILGAYILLILALFFANIVFQILTSVVQALAGVLGVMGAGGEVIVLVVTLFILVASLAFGVFTTGVQMAFPASIYRRLWRE